MDELDLLIQSDPVVWLESQTKVRVPSGKLEPVRANILQRRIAAVFREARRTGRPCFVIGLKPRKRGFSTMVAAINYMELNKHCFHGVIVGNKLETSDTVYKMIRTFGENDDQKGNWGSPIRATTEKMVWQHGSELTMSTAKAGDSIRGQTPQFVHGTEVAHWDGEEEFLLGLLNAVPDSPEVSVFLESTPKGAAGAFFDRWNEARWPTDGECPKGQAGYWKKWEASCPDTPDSMLAEHEFVRVFAAWFEFEDARIPLNDEQRRYIERTLDAEKWHEGERALMEAYGETGPNGIMRLGTIVENTDVWEQLAWRRNTIRNKCGRDPHNFDQEYPRDPASCFLSSGRAVFDADAIEHYKVLATRTREFGMLVRPPGALRASWVETAEEDAIFWRWEQPREGCAYLIVVDTAEGDDQTKGDDPDRHSLWVLRAAYRSADGTLHKPAAVARVRPPCRVPIHALVEWADLLCWHYGRCVVLPEMNSSGLAFITAAQLKGMPIWERVEMNHRSGRKEKKLGWRTTDTADYGGVRTLIITTLHQMIREKEIDLFCPHAVMELSKFVDKNGRMEAASGYHDDDVMALAIGVYNLGSATVMGYYTVDDSIPADLRAEIEAQRGPMANEW